MYLDLLALQWQKSTRREGAEYADVAGCGRFLISSTIDGKFRLLLNGLLVGFYDLRSTAKESAKFRVPSMLLGKRQFDEETQRWRKEDKLDE